MVGRGRPDLLLNWTVYYIWKWLQKLGGQNYIKKWKLSDCAAIESFCVWFSCRTGSDEIWVDSHHRRGCEYYDVRLHKLG